MCGSGKMHLRLGGSTLLHLLEPRRLMSAYVDIRLPDGTHTIDAPYVGEVINLQMWEVINGADSDGSNEQFISLFGSILSANTGDGSVRGDLTGTLNSNFDSLGLHTIGTQADHDGDGDLDLGSNNANDPTGYLFAYSLSSTSNGDLIGEGLPGAGQEFHIADLQFTVTSLDDGPATTIGFALRPQLDSPNYDSAGWIQDGSATSIQGGAAFGAGIGVQILPEPASLTIAAAGAAIFLRRKNRAQNQFSNESVTKAVAD